MAGEELVLGRSCVLGADFGRAVGRVARRQLDQAVAVARDNAERSGGKLRPVDPAGNVVRFASFVEGAHATNQLLRALQALSGGRPEEYAPGEGQQAQFLATLAGNTPLEVNPVAALEELVAAAADDVREWLAGERSRAGREQDRADGAEDRARFALEELEELRGANEAAVEEADALRARLADVEAQRDFLSALTGDGATEKPAPSRRVPVEGHQGVYCTTLADGQVRYEIRWSEDGKDRWRTVGSDLEEAVAARAELVGVVA